MKVWSTLALFASLSTAASVLVPDSAGTVLEHPYALSAAVSVPKDAPADFHTEVTQLPAGTSIQKSKSRDTSSKPRDTVAANDFFECATTGNPPAASDCEVVISNVLAADQGVVIAPGACLLFQFNTCWGFFCSLCQRLGTSTDFIGSQLETAQTLCVSGGAAGTVVGEDAPQWEAGFVHSSGVLPNYAGDVC
ncbi:hypothetical protein GGR55DRAFT_691780 [Xylaria sp. FL0064]|nr:hypothetical protein GGR55DRAFT_691780 [Xylaria sp. FL0064]